MAQADSKSITRRTVITAISGVVVVPAAALANGGAGTIDPICAAIERHREACAAVCRAVEATDAAFLAAGDWRHPSIEPYQAAQAAATNRLTEAEINLAQTQPTTIAGIAAIMTYVRETRTDEELVFADCTGDPRHNLASWLLTIERAATALAGVGRV